MGVAAQKHVMETKMMKQNHECNGLQNESNQPKEFTEFCSPDPSSLMDQKVTDGLVTLPHGPVKPQKGKSGASKSCKVHHVRAFGDLEGTTS